MKPQPTSIPPCVPGNSGHALSLSLSNNSQDSNKIVSFRQVMFHWCCIIWRNSHQNTTSTTSTLFHIWFAQNVYPLITGKRMFYFVISQISFFLAYGFFTQTKLYRSYIHGDDENHDHDNSVLHQARPLIFLVAAFGVHTMCLIFLFFFSFCSMALERYWYHYILESLGEYLVKLLVVLLIIGIGDSHPVRPLYAAIAPTPTQTQIISFNGTKLNYYEVAGLATWCFLTIDALSIIGLLNPGHHYTLLEAVVTLTLHLGLARGSHYRIPAALFVLVIVVIKNFLWQRMDHPQASTNTQHCPVAWVAPEVV